MYLPNWFGRVGTQNFIQKNNGLLKRKEKLKNKKEYHNTHQSRIYIFFPTMRIGRPIYARNSSSKPPQKVFRFFGEKDMTTIIPEV